MLLLLKIIYKAFYKTKNRRDSTKSAFSGIVTYFFITTIFFLFIISTKGMFSNSPEIIIKIILGAIVFGLGFSTFFLCTKYVNKQFENERVYADIKFSVIACRAILIVINIMGVLYFPAIYILGLFDKGTLIPQAAFGFTEHTKTGRYLATGNTAKTADFVKTMKLAKPLTRGIAVVNFAATATSVTDDLYHGRYKSAGARTTVWGIAAGATFIPVAGWGIAIGIGIADAIGGDDFYECVEKNW